MKQKLHIWLQEMAYRVSAGCLTKLYLINHTRYNNYNRSICNVLQCEISKNKNVLSVLNPKKMNECITKAVLIVRNTDSPDYQS